MNGITMLGLAIIIFIIGYFTYGRWLAKSWGIDSNAQTPAYKYEDGQDYTPASKFMVFSHQFSSVAGAGPVTGPIIAAMFGWLPAFLWIVLGGLFFGGVQDFVSLYASVKNEGKSMGVLIEQYIGKTGKKLFLFFCWLFTLLVIAAFADIVATTFNGFAKDGSQSLPGAAAASISMIYIAGSLLFGIFVKKLKPSETIRFIAAIILMVLMISAGIAFPMYFTRDIWIIIALGYSFIASVLPMWLLMQPRDYLSTFLLIGMIISAVAGIIIANPTINMPAFVGFEVKGQGLFPILFITIACGAVSGFHSLVSSGTSSKTVSNEKDMLFIGYGSMLVECVLGVAALVIVCAAATNGQMPEGTPFQIFSGAVAGFLSMFGLPEVYSVCVITMCVSALAFTTLDTVVRVGRLSLQELCSGDSPETMNPIQKICVNKYASTLITIGIGYMLCRIGYMNIWPLFGSANQLLSALVLICMAVFLRMTNRKGWMLYIPTVIMFLVTLTALSQAVYRIISKLITGSGFIFMIDGLQFIIAVALMVLAVSVASHCGRELLHAKKNISPGNSLLEDK
ncbi:carbon starvation CstA family protein [Pectinatus haikarae]|uniref:Carbon starvation protein n=1 Tax=Pectinatus haikarae TaxID=349096 RepID=A0ABT9YAQ4_9FIRM|nr:carbon starvation protein A [Pectinatus haikarae]MDQ0204282.1 carbon starvation protein [Pectinatus haikarae]